MDNKYLEYQKIAYRKYNIAKHINEYYSPADYVWHISSDVYASGYDLIKANADIHCATMFGIPVHVVGGENVIRLFREVCKEQTNG